MSRIRQLQHTELQKIEYDNVLSRLGELAYRNLAIYSRALYHSEPSVEAAIVGDGLRTTFDSGMTVTVSSPGIALQKSGTDKALFAYEDEDASITFDAAHATLPRIDIIEARVRRRDALQDDQVLVVTDPVSKTIGPETRYRDFEYYLEIRKKTGVPDVSPVPIAPTAATQAIYTGTVVVPATVDLSTTYYLELAVGEDSEYELIDLRGATPAATTRAEILSAINAVFPGFAAYDGSFHLEFTTSEVLKIRQPFMGALDTFTLLLGGVQTPGYEVIVQGDLAYFKLAEVLIPQNSLAVIPANIRSVENKDTEWDTLASTIRLLLNYSDHVTNPVLDHPDGSVYLVHLAPEVMNAVSEKVTNYRGVHAKPYIVSGFPRTGKVFLEDIQLKAADGSVLTVDKFEQVYTRSRVDQKQDADVSGSYNPLLVISELAADIIPFTPDVNLLYSLEHSRAGIYIKTVGSGYTHIRVDMHDNSNNEVATFSIPFADISAVGAGAWIYCDLPFTMTSGVTYHYHAYVVGFTVGTTPTLGMSAGNVIAFREFYKPTSGLYGGGSQADVFVPIDEQGADIVPANISTIDDITLPGEGASSLAAFDIMTVDFSVDAVWEAWSYYNFIGIDPENGRMSVPVGQQSDNIFIEFNVKEPLNLMDAKNLLLHSRPQSVEDAINGAGYWLKKTFSYADFQTAALTQFNELLLVPAGYMLDIIILIHPTNFAITGGSFLRLRVGTIADDDLFITDEEMLAGASATDVRRQVDYENVFSLSADTAIRATLTSDVNLSNLTVGSMILMGKLSKIGGGA